MHHTFTLLLISLFGKLVLFIRLFLLYCLDTGYQTDTIETGTLLN
ncbi:hypothetical protein MmTuc01_0948 [Methanosarcina mazei Tuc01]|uniref:Uncharacterized protein n=1 Tax=Methanosarcina mazei Tuc01 TaxID=1236903 RepID=M1Q844_METMZ|nr:hypothetical protein MmTuc01_0948 [Methanosarcina mazei Tuc01]